jgi:hypothetical protein
VVGFGKETQDLEKRTISFIQWALWFCSFRLLITRPGADAEVYICHMRVALTLRSERRCSSFASRRSFLMICRYLLRLVLWLRESNAVSSGA